MNKQLIINNIRNLETCIEQDDAAKACSLGLSLVRMMITQMKSDGQDDSVSRGLYIGYAGVTAALSEGYDALLDTYTPSADAADTAKKIEEAHKTLKTYAAEKKEIEEKNSELLSEKEALEKEKTELENQKQEIDSLRKLKEETLVRLRDEVRKCEAALEELEKELDKAKEECEHWRPIFDEDMRLLCDLPETIAEKQADEIIKKAKEYAASVSSDAEKADQWLTDVMNAVKDAAERVKQA